MTLPFILLVDDEVSFVETTAKRLAKRNFQTINAFNGKEALETLAKNPNLDVVVLDVKMPGMDGLETLKEIKKKFALVEVILLTGHATVESAMHGIKLGAYDYLMKPCDIEELVSKVKSAARRKQALEEQRNNQGKFTEASTLKELMVPLAEYASISEDANVFEAFNALEDSQKAFDPKRYRHRAILVLDQNERVVGKLSQHDIIQALEPKHKKSKERSDSALGHFGFSQKFIESVSMQYDMWDRPLQNIYEKALQQKVKSFMHTPTRGEYIEVSATINDVIHRLIIGEHHSLLVTDGPNILGIVRLTDVFDLIHLRLKALHLAAKIGGTADSE